MDYVVECRFSQEFYESEAVRELVPTARDIVLFSRSFAYEGDVPEDMLREIVGGALRQTQDELGGAVDLSVDEIAIEQGSVIIILLISGIAVTVNVTLPGAAAAGATVTLSGIAAWFLKPAIGEFAKKLVDRIFEYMPGNRQKPKKAGTSPIRDPDSIARSKAEQMASERGSQLRGSSGPIATVSGSGQPVYEYTFELKGDSPGTIKVQVDRTATQVTRAEFVPKNQAA